MIRYIHIRQVLLKFATSQDLLFDKTNIQLISPIPEVIVLTKHHKLRTKSMGLLLMSKFWSGWKFWEYPSGTYLRNKNLAALNPFMPLLSVIVGSILKASVFFVIMSTILLLPNEKLLHHNNILEH